jgi:glycosyltransferase involved in cell wall biosynthesis
MSSGGGLESKAEFLKGLRVCFLAGTLGQGGAERQLYYILKTLKECGAEVTLFSLTQGEHWERVIGDLGIPVIFVGGSRSRLTRLFAITRAARKFRPDILQSQHFYTNGYSAVAARILGAVAIGAVRGNGAADIQNCGSWLAKACFKLPHFLAANSRAAVQAMISLGCPEDKLHFLPNVIDLNRFHPGSNRGSRQLTILGVGRLGPEKRFDRFLRVLVLLKKSCNIPFRAIIAGDGLLRRELEEMSHSVGLGPHILEFCGSVAEVETLYRKANLLLLTSDHEGTPNVVMEAMASGLPVVSTAVGGVSDLVRHGVTGFLSEPGDDQALADGLGTLLTDEALRLEMSRCGRAFIEKQHALDSLPRQLEGLYRQVVRIAGRASVWPGTT